MVEQFIADGALHWDTIDYYGDHDTYGMWMNAGQHYALDVYGFHGSESAGYLGDPTLAVYDCSGTALYAYNDDVGWNGSYYNYDSHIDFTPTDSGWYQLDVGGYADAHTGTYLLWPT